MALVRWFGRWSLVVAMVGLGMLLLVGTGAILSAAPAASTLPLPTLIGTAQADSGPIGIVADEETNTVFVVNNHGADAAGNPDRGSFSVINGTDLQGQTFRNGAVVNPLGAAFNSRTRKLYATDNLSDASGGLLTIIDVGNLNAFTQIKVGGEPKGVAVNRNTNRIYTANHGDIWRSISVVDGAAGQEITKIPVAGMPVFVAVDEDLNRIYVTSWELADLANQVVTAIDGNNNSVLWTRKPQGEPYGVVVRPDDHTVLVTSNTGAQGMLTVYDRDGNELLRKAHGQRMSGITYNPGTGRAFVSTRFDGDVPGLLVVDRNLDEETRFTDNVGIPDDGIGINPRTGQVFFGDWGGSAVRVIQDAVQSVATPTPTATATATPIVNPYLELSSTNVNFIVRQGWDGPAPAQQVRVVNRGLEPLVWQLNLVPDPGSSYQRFDVSPITGTSTLTASSVITITALGAYSETVSANYNVVGNVGTQNSPQPLRVRLLAVDEVRRAYLPVIGKE